jgi:hypothetical protein
MTRSTPLLSVASLLTCLVAACDQPWDQPGREELDAEASEDAVPALAPGGRALVAAPVVMAAAGDCCSVDGAPGCSDGVVEACVCAVDSYCCTTAWDGLCVAEVESLGCGTCVEPYCCAAATTPGCVDAAVEACVCAVDSYCCTTAWDGLCASEVESLGCGSCASGWAVSFGGTGFEAVEPSGAVAVDDEGNVYVLGTFYSPTIDLGAGPEVRQGYSDVFLVSYAGNGAYRWSRRLGGGSWEYARGVGVDGAGNVYVTGETEGTLELGGAWLPPSGGARDLFVASYTATGEHRWSQRHGAPGTSLFAHDLAVDDAGNLVVAGSVRTSHDDMLVLALDSAGAIRWSRTMGAAGDEIGMGVAVDASGGAVIAGYFTGAVDFGTGPVTSAGSADGVVIRLDALGSTQWVRRYGNYGIDIAEDVAMDALGNVYMIGTFKFQINLGDGPRLASGSSEGLVASYGPDGELRWSRRVGGAGLDYGRGIALDPGGHVVATGSFFGGAADFGGAALVGAGGYDVFLASYDGGDGAHRWSTRLGTPATEEGYDVAVAPSGAVAVVGRYGSTLPVAGVTLVTAGESDVFLASVNP